MAKSFVRFGALKNIYKVVSKNIKKNKIPAQRISKGSRQFLASHFIKNHFTLTFIFTFQRGCFHIEL